MRLRACVALALLAAGLCSGCVTRRVMITSDPPGAIVYRDGQPLGPTPVEHPFVYYGKYRYRLVKDGYAPLDVEPELVTPWYQYAGIDLIAESFVPFTFRDTQQLHFQLVPLQAVRFDDVRARAEQLRNQGKSIGAPAGTLPQRSRKEEAAPPAESLTPRRPGEDGPLLPGTPRKDGTLIPLVPAALTPSPGAPSR